MKYDWEERFWSRVDKRGANECWEYRGARNNIGYGSVVTPYGTAVAHRVAWFLMNGGIEVKAPADKSVSELVLHKCDNRSCCNPNHLFLGTQSDNMTDMYCKGRHHVYRGSTHANSKLSDSAAAEVRRYYKAGFTQATIAGWAGVSQVAVGLITRGKTYRT